MQEKYDLLRDGKVVLSYVDFLEITQYIHANHSFSFSWALQYEGYEVVQAVSQ